VGLLGAFLCGASIGAVFIMFVFAGHK
jgi:hypothetical protein